MYEEPDRNPIDTLLYVKCMCIGVCVVCLFVAPYFLCTVFISQFDSTCVDRPPLIVCTTHLHTMKNYYD